jgi:hypothetical protein
MKDSLWHARPSWADDSRKSRQGAATGKFMTEDHRKAFERELYRRVAQVAGELKQSRPEFSQYECKAEIFAYSKTPRGYFSHPERIVDAFLSSSALLHMTNDKIVEKLAEWFPGYRPSTSVMTRPIDASAREAIQALLDAAKLPITVQPGDTLSKLKLAIRAQRRVQIAQSVTLKVELSDEYVAINDTPYLIDANRRDPAIPVEVKGKRQYLRCDILQALLDDAGQAFLPLEEE